MKGKFVRMVKARGLDLSRILDETEVSLGYLGNIDSESIRLSKKMANKIDQLSGNDEGNFYSEFYAEGSK